MLDMVSNFLIVWSVVTCKWPLASIPPLIWQRLNLSPPPPPPLLLLTPHTLVSINQLWREFIQSLLNVIIWYVAPVVAGWEATVYAVFRPITLTSQPTHKESFERPVFGGIRWAFCPITAEWIQLQQTDVFTKLCVGGAGEIRCATLNSRGLIIGWRKSAKLRHFLFACLRGRITLDRVFKLTGLLDKVSGVAHVKDRFSHFEFHTLLMHIFTLNLNEDSKRMLNSLYSHTGKSWITHFQFAQFAQFALLYKHMFHILY